VIVEEPDVTARLYDSQEAKDALAIFSRLRGDVIGYLPQQARDSLDPLWTVGKQVQEAMDLAGHSDRVEDWLRRAGFQHPDQVMALYPHELSGGMAQRVCIALAIARGSRFLLADEPTTGLDPTVQRSILDELKRTAEAGVGILLITHDLRIVPEYADQVIIMSEGRVVEHLDAARLAEAESDMARSLLAATDRISHDSLGSHDV
jgi:ABC-type dipeptide/oligopeptide/nickel transport system ATPase component